MDRERPLRGGATTDGVCRAGSTVRRPATRNSPFVHELLCWLESAGFDGAPRSLGFDEQGRHVLAFIEGTVLDLRRRRPAAAELCEAGALLRRFHEATAGTALTGDCEIVRHGDLGPHNTVFVEGRPAAFIDWDDAAPGRRIDDVADAVWAWTNVGCDRRSPGDHAAAIAAFCRGYGDIDPAGVAAAIEASLVRALDRHRNAGRVTAASVFVPWVRWFVEHGGTLRRLLQAA